MIYGLAQFFNLFNIVFIGTSISIFVVSYFIYKPFDEVNYESDTDEDEFYEYKYLEDYYDLLDKKLKLKEKENQDEVIESEYSKEDGEEDGEEDREEDGEEDGDEDKGEEEEEEKDEEEDDELYEENEDLVSLKDNFIEEKSPRGIIYMAYDNSIESYIYYSKTKDIPYKYLETVARKYVIDNKCLNIYVDYKEEYIQGLNKYKQRLQERKEFLEKKKKEQEQKEDEYNVENKKKNIFANFKSYNKQDKSTKNNTDTSTKEYILTENSNHYKYKGNLDDYEQMLKEKASQESVLKEYEQIDFKAYKNMIKK
jgi:hypothetical protein